MRFAKFHVVAAFGTIIIISTISIAHAQTRVGFCNISANDFISIEGGYAFISGNEGLCSVDISDPEHPRELDAISLPHSAYHVFVSKGYAYLTGFSQYFMIVNVMDPDSLFLVSSLLPDYDEYQVHCTYVRNEILYIVGCHNFGILDVTNKLDPVEISHVRLPTGDTRGLWIEENQAFVPDFDHPILRIFDITNPYAPVSLTSDSLSTLGTYFLKSADSFVYMTGGNPRYLRVVDATNPVHPISVDSLTAFPESRSLFINNNHLFVASWQRGLYIYNIMDRAHPAAEGYFESNCYSVAADDNYIYIPCNGDTLLVLAFDATPVGGDDVPLPSRPSALRAYPNPFNSTTMISMKDTERAEIAIYDIHGRLVAELRAENGRALWSAAGQTSGIYFAKIADGHSEADVVKLIYLK